MIYLFENPGNKASVVYDETGLSAEHKAKAIIIDVLPEPEVRAGKMHVLKCRKDTNEVWYDYVDNPEVDVLQGLLNDALNLLAESEVL